MANRDRFRFAIVKGAPDRITENVISFLEFEKRVTAKTRLIGVKFKGAATISRPDFFGRCFGCQVKHEIVVLFHTARSTVEHRKSHRGSGGQTSHTLFGLVEEINHSSGTPAQQEVAKKEFLNKETAKISKRGVPGFAELSPVRKRRPFGPDVWIKYQFLWDLCELLCKVLSS